MALQSYCCCGLRGGALAVGIVFLVLSVLHLVGVIITWGAVDVLRSNTVAVYGVDTPQRYSPLGSLEEMMFIPQTVLAVLSLLFNSLLVHGSKNFSSCAVLAWLVYYGILFALFTLGSLGLMIACFVYVSTANSADHRNDRALARVLAMVFGATAGVILLLAALFWYSWAVVLAFQQQVHAATAGFKHRRDNMLLQEAPSPQPMQPPLPAYVEAAIADAPNEETRKDAQEKWEHV